VSLPRGYVCGPPAPLVNLGNNRVPDSLAERGEKVGIGGGDSLCKAGPETSVAAGNGVLEMVFWKWCCEASPSAGFLLTHDGCSPVSSQQLSVDRCRRNAGASPGCSFRGGCYF